MPAAEAAWGNAMALPLGASIDPLATSPPAGEPKRFTLRTPARTCGTFSLRNEPAMCSRCVLWHGMSLKTKRPVRSLGDAPRRAGLPSPGGGAGILPCAGGCSGVLPEVANAERCQQLPKLVDSRPVFACAEMHTDASCNPTVEGPSDTPCCPGMSARIDAGSARWRGSGRFNPGPDAATAPAIAGRTALSL